MALNLDKIKERMEKIQNKGGGSSNYWKPEDGAVVRILPSPDGDPVKDFHIHYEIARGGVLCPKRNFGDDCVVCSFASKLYAAGKEKNNQEDYIGGATFMEIVKAWELGKLIYLYNEIPESLFTDEISAINPTIINGNLELLK